VSECVHVFKLPVFRFVYVCVWKSLQCHGLQRGDAVVQELKQIHTLLGAWLQIRTDVSEICKKPKNNVLFVSLLRRSASTSSVVWGRKFIMKRVCTLFGNKMSAV